MRNLLITLACLGILVAAAWHLGTQFLEAQTTETQATETLTTETQTSGIPELTGRIVDIANVLRAETAISLDTTLESYETRTGDQIVVLAIPSLQGQPVESYALNVAREWALGTEEKDNGILFLIAIEERKSRIEVGRGVEGVFPDGLVGQILRDEVVPHLQSEDFDEGITSGIVALTGVRDGTFKADSYSSDSSEQEMGTGMRIFLGCFIGLFLVGISCLSLFTIRGYWQYLPVATIGSLISLGIGFIFGIAQIFWLSYLVVYVALSIYVGVKSGFASRWSSSGKSSSESDRDRSRDDSYSSSTSSSYSGGGGSFSGGGASEDW